MKAQQTLDDLLTPRPLAEWHEEDGDVLWWKFPLSEAPWVGSPLCCGFTLRIDASTHANGTKTFHANVGGWTGYYTHWTPLPYPRKPHRTAHRAGEQP